MRGGGGSINDASDALREQLDKQPTLDLDNLFSTIDSLKKTRDEKLKRDFDFQKEAYNLKATARNSGFDINYDPHTNQITPVAMPVPEPPRVNATRGANLNDDQLAGYMQQYNLTKDQALKKLQGGMTTVSSEGTPPKPGSEPLKTQTDPGSEAVMAGFKQNLITKAKGGTAAKGKPLTESQRTAISYQEKVNRMTNKIKPLLNTANRIGAAQPKLATTVEKGISKLLPGKAGKSMYKSADQQEALRDYMQQLEATIPFAKGGRTLSPTEFQILHRLLEFGPSTSNESLKRNLDEFVTEYSRMGKLASENPTPEELISQLAARDLEDMKGSGDVDSQESELEKFRKENDLE